MDVVNNRAQNVGLKPGSSAISAAPITTNAASPTQSGAKRNLNQGCGRSAIDAIIAMFAGRLATTNAGARVMKNVATELAWAAVFSADPVVPASAVPR